MGWSSGSELACKMIDLIEYLSDNEDEKIKVFHDMIGHFEDVDCDTIYECLGESSAFDKAYKELYPDHYKHLMDDEDD